MDGLLAKIKINIEAVPKQASCHKNKMVGDAAFNFSANPSRTDC
jgi:hypothetical protein